MFDSAFEAVFFEAADIRISVHYWIFTATSLYKGDANSQYLSEGRLFAVKTKKDDFR